MKVEIKTAGFAEVRKALEELCMVRPGAEADATKKAVMAGLRGGGKLVAQRAQDLAPVLAKPTPGRRAGVLKAAIRSQASKKHRGQGGKWEVIVKVRTAKDTKKAKVKGTEDDPFYWWFQEFGTAHHPPRPFLRPAFASSKDQALSRIREAMARRIATLKKATK